MSRWQKFLCWIGQHDTKDVWRPFNGWWLVNHRVCRRCAKRIEISRCDPGDAEP